MYNNLHIELRRRDIPQKVLASKIGITDRTMPFKIRGLAEFTLEEARQICRALEISDPQKVCWLFEKEAEEDGNHH